jgi:protein MpaA
MGGVHGDEPEGVEVSQRLEVAFKTHWSHQYTHVTSPYPWIAFAHQVNPDGLTQRTRVNANGVDLNRNYPTQNWQAQATETHFPPGPYPASEPETRATVRLIRCLQPRHILTLHAPLYCVNYDGPDFETLPWAEAVAHAIDYPLEASIGYPTLGSFGTYWGVERGVSVMTLELPPANEHPHAPPDKAYPSFDTSHAERLVTQLSACLFSPSV